MKKSLLLIFFLSFLNSFCQAVLLKDINLGTYSSNPTGKTQFNGLIYFIADDGIHGQELWKTDGTESGTELFKDFIPGLESGMTTLSPFVSNNFMYFFAADNDEFFLWKTDGTESGTRKIKKFTSIQSFHDTINDEMIFTAENKLWKTDGTESGTIKIKDFSVFGTSRFIKMNDQIYFSAKGNSNQGNELWKTDGTETGTVQVKDVNVGSGSTFSTNTPIVVFNNELFFVYGTKLWKSDGSESGTLEVMDLESNVKSFFIFNSKLCFFNFGNSFWFSDGTKEGTSKINTDVKEFWHNGQYMISGNKLYFQGNDSNGYEIWVTDGTASGTQLLKDIHPEFDDNNIEDIIDFNGNVIFTASDKNWFGKELWISDGTVSGTKILKDINKEGTNSSNVQNFFKFGDNVLFSADNGENGRELWLLESGTPTLLKDINIGPAYSNPQNFIEFNGEVYFMASDKEKGNELWKTDGTETGTINVFDLNPGNENGLGNSNLAILNNKLFFVGSNGTSGMELWETDGTKANTKIVANINGANSNSINNSKLVVLNNELFFAANNGESSVELWKSDGSNSGTVLVKDINTNGGSYVNNLTVHSYLNKLYFSAFDGSGTYLWESDGTEANTIKTNLKNPSNFKIGGSRDIGDRNGANIIYKTEIYLSAESPNLNKGTELWAITYSGTIQQVFDVNSGTASSYPSALTDVNGKLYFVANNGINGKELWKANGVSSAQMVKDIVSGSGSVQITNIGSIGDFVFFNAPQDPTNNPLYDYELWMSDGSDEGTKMFQDINPSQIQYRGGSNPNIFFKHNDILYFSADNGNNGFELFMLEQSALGINKESFNTLEKVSIYPNPTTNIINIKVENQIIEAVGIFNLLGKEVFRCSNKEIKANSINVSMLTNGIYVVKVKTKIGSYSRKFIKT
ncbi:T9SS type A sorting domain-containing protein [Polaribacter ponticola]|uniref:T9SS type A sorting domain-containing protein n=1 Tax=Polaribacter ponticola TaxID=2978475 RepID=A0ABT5SAT9_9FLAO|nr:T9SS type A sorting domain-containing protein [Polaribacter sp. MSW5]MDD7915234.1 T9SS type A sorting domain-containing protein [Polaribacter sp. MSW5]